MKNFSWTKPIRKQYVDIHNMLYIVGALLMATLPILDTLKCHMFPSSISYTYYLLGRDIFESMLMSVGIIFLVNSGYNNLDRLCNFIVFLSCTGVVSFPCNSPHVFLKSIPFANMHYLSAITLFSTFAFECLYVFRQLRGQEVWTRAKVIRNRIYLFSGIAIITGMVGIVLCKLIIPKFDQAIYVGEVWMIYASVVPFLTQGKIIFKEKS